MVMKRLVEIFKGIYLSSRNVSFKATWQNAFGKHLLLTNTGTCGILMFAGDIFQQELEYQRHMLPERYDWTRLFRMSLVGFGYGPMHHYFYMALDRRWPIRNIASVTKKILMDQFFMSPACIAYFFYVAGLLELKNLKECTDEFLEKALEVYTVDWCVWPPTQFINFYFLPVKYQVLYINTITMLYNVFLSYVKHREVAQNHLSQYIEKLETAT